MVCEDGFIIIHSLLDINNIHKLIVDGSIADCFLVNNKLHLPSNVLLDCTKDFISEFKQYEGYWSKKINSFRGLGSEFGVILNKTRKKEVFNIEYEADIDKTMALALLLIIFSRFFSSDSVGLGVIFDASDSI